MTITMTKEERETFLAGLHIGILSVSQNNRGPLSVPVWYLYEPEGDVRIWTGANSRKAKLLRAAGRASFCVQQETRPYRYVSVEGPVSIEPVQLERDVRALAYRYLGSEEGEKYVLQAGGSSAGSGDILVRLHPEHWISEDYSKMDG